MTVSAGTWTSDPRIVSDGFSRPSILNNGLLSSLAKGMFGLGETGVPSTRAHAPTTLRHPITECNTHACSLIIASANTILSRTRTPAAIRAFAPTLTLGPIFAVGSI
ncbi:unnamed protein product [Gongylonema pulchrum]|uniref:Uncharacterized protein n=1 Tax=Gongylonema pulchrum TaxID=637853 RepID=A0A183ETZ0_9BILA|nr:unnamed protein product [Gongylonema pulchrum]